MIYPAHGSKSVELCTQNAKVINGIFKKDGVYPAFSGSSEGVYNCPGNIVETKYLTGCKQYLMYADDKGYVSSNGMKFVESMRLAATTPVIVEEFYNGVPTGMMLGDKAILTFYKEDGTDTEGYVGSAPLISCGAMHAGRLFGADQSDGYKLKWTGEGGARDTKTGIFGAGYVLFDPALGKILDVCNLGAQLALVRELGITLMTAGGSPDAFSMSYAHASTPRIFPKSAQVAGGKLYFYTEDGLYSFSGGRAQKTESPLRDDLSEITGSCGGRGLYFLCGYSKLLGRKGVLVLDAHSGATALSDLPAEKISVSDTVYGYGSGRVYKLTGGEKVRLIQSTDFGVRGKKCLSSLKVKAEAPVDFKITSGGVTRVVSGVTDGRKLVMCGNDFTFEAISEGAIYSVTPTAEVIDGI